MNEDTIKKLSEALGFNGVRILSEIYGVRPQNFYKYLDGTLKVPPKSRRELKRDLKKYFADEYSKNLEKVKEVLG